MKFACWRPIFRTNFKIPCTWKLLTTFNRLSDWSLIWCYYFFCCHSLAGKTKNCTNATRRRFTLIQQTANHLYLRYSELQQQQKRIKKIERDQKIKIMTTNCNNSFKKHKTTKPSSWILLPFHHPILSLECSSPTSRKFTIHCYRFYEWRK